MKISKAMKNLKKLKNKASSIAEKIKKHNRKLAENEKIYNVFELLREYRIIMSEIISTKEAIMKANIESGNYDRILRVGELKGLKSLLDSVDTNKGVEDGPYSYRSNGGNSKNYEVQIDEKSMESIIAGIEEEIEWHIDALDEFNAKTEI